MARTIPGGAEIELTMLFADVRDSTSLAEWMSPLEYSQLINRFYIVGTEVLVDTRALVDRLVGDQVVGLYVPGFAGRKHAQLAVRAAKEFLRRTGHEEGNQRWVEVGIGIHTDVAFVGAVGTGGGATDITVLGDAPNTAARLSSSAAAGDILISSAAYSNLGPLDDNLETRILELKGKSEPVTVHVIKAS
jgi:adenylate cyclase